RVADFSAPEHVRARKRLAARGDTPRAEDCLEGGTDHRQVDRSVDLAAAAQLRPRFVEAMGAGRGLGARAAGRGFRAAIERVLPAAAARLEHGHLLRVVALE